MSANLARMLVTVAAAAGAAIAAPLVSVGAAPAAGSTSGTTVVKVTPRQFFIAQVNAKFSKATIKVACPGVANTGHPLAHQTVKVTDVPVSGSQGGYTGTAGTSIAAWLTWTASKPSSPVYVATFTSYRTLPIPTSITVPCSGSARMLFLPARGSPTVKAATVSVTFANLAP